MNKNEIKITCKAADYVPVEKLDHFQGNLKTLDKAQFEKIWKSIETKGFIFPVFVWNDPEGNKKIIDGHQRVFVVKKMLQKGYSLEKDIPVAWIDCPTEKEAKEAVLLASSRYARVSDTGLADYMLEADLSIELMLPLIDLPDIDLDNLDLNKLASDVLPDDVIPEKPKKPKTKLSDLITLGNHRLLCGDATNPDHVKRLFDGVTPLMLVTDPPYGVHYDPEWRIEHDKSENHRVGKVNNDDRVDWSAAYQLFPGDIAYVWHAGIYAGDIAANLRDSNLFIRAQIIWRKQHFVFSRGAYHWQHEPCWYAVRKGKKSLWCGDRTQSTLWEIENRNPFGGKTEDADTQHSTQKPVECMGRPIRNHGNKGDVVYDPFVGAGTTIVAAEHLERRCLAIEIDPGYCDVTIERWEKLTGKKAERTHV